MNLTTILSLITFITVTSSLMILYNLLEEKIRRIRMEKVLFGEAGKEKSAEKKSEDLLWYKAAYSLGFYAVPQKEKELDEMRSRLRYAGYRSAGAHVVFSGLKLLFCLGLGGAYLGWELLSGSFSSTSLIILFLPAGMGYMIPVWALRYQIQEREKKIFRELPDALDLLIICMEAGLNFDMALYRVSSEFAGITPILAKEFEQYFIEIRSGLPRKNVLMNLAERNSSKQLESVVSVLLQSSKYGTDIADALRVYTDSMRVERRQVAEEKGGKVAAKLTLPLVTLIMPALMIIILAPAIISLMDRFK